MKKEMKRLLPLVSLSILILLLVFDAGIVTADAPGNGADWVTGFFVTNTELLTATVRMEFFEEGSDVPVAAIAKDIRPGDTSFYYLGAGGGFESVLDDGLFSLILQADKEIVAVANATSQKAADPDRVNSTMSYAALANDAVASKLFAPNILRNYYRFSSNFVLQNAGDSVANVTISYFGPDGNEIVGARETDVPIQPGSFITRDQVTNDLLPTGNSEGLMSATFECADCRLAGIVHVTNVESDIGTSNYVMYSQGITKGYGPVILNDYFGFSTSINVQNFGDIDTDATITFYGETGQGAGSLQLVRTLKASDPVAEGGLGGLLAPGQTWSVYTGPQGLVNSGANGSLALPAGQNRGDLSATIEADSSEIVALINTSQDAPVELPERATASLASYRVVKSGGKLLYASAANARAFNQEYFVSVTCQDLSGNETEIYYTFNGVNTKTGIPVNNIQDKLSSIRLLQEGIGGKLQPNESFVFLMNLPENIQGIDPGFNGSVTITSDEDVACIVNQNRLLDVLSDEDHLGAYTP